MKKMLIYCSFLIFQPPCIGQAVPKPTRHALSAEFGKTGIFFHISYDHKFRGSNFGVRGSMGSTLGIWINAKAFSAGAYHLFGKKNNFFELGADLQYLILDEMNDDPPGGTIFYPDNPLILWHPSVIAGFRRYRKSVLFRAGFAPGLIDGELFPGTYISFGFLLPPK